MYRLIVSLPVNRDVEGSLRLEDDDGRVIAGPFGVCGRADREAAGRHGNPSCNALLPFGDTPLGRYRMTGILPTGLKDNLSADRFGPYGVVVLQPMAGDAALADANGRFCIVIQGGKLGPGRRLRPTNGSLRLADSNQKKLVRALRKRGSCVCDCVAATGPVTGRTVALAAPCDEADPPLGGALGGRPVVASLSVSQRDHGFLLERSQIRHFNTPSFRLFADSGGGGGGGGYEPDSSSTALLNEIDTVVAEPDVQPGYPDANGNTDTTWCNRAAYRIVTDSGYDMSAVLQRSPDTGQPDIDWTTANNMAQNAAAAAADPNSGVTPLTAEQARNLANTGVPILVVADNPNGPGHAAVVAPSQGDVTMIGQAGATNGVMPLTSGFGGLSDSVSFYRLPRA